MFDVIDKVLFCVVLALLVALGAMEMHVRAERATTNKVRLELAQSKTDLANYKESVAETTRLLQADNDRKHIAQLNQVMEAKNAAEARNTKLAADAAATQRSLDSLRNAVRVAARRDRVSQPPATPDSDLLPVVNQLFLECATAYGQLAKQADAIASERQALIEAWPK